MLTVTVRYLRESFPSLRSVGVLATSGTIESGVCERALNSQGLKQIVPRPPLQARVMDAIYGNEGVKPGFTTGQCQSDIAAAIDALIAEGVEVVILGCTELPLLPHADSSVQVAQRCAWSTLPMYLPGSALCCLRHRGIRITPHINH
jgi:aspartate racemase